MAIKKPVVAVDEGQHEVPVKKNQKKTQLGV
jgi:hypothetical protein